MGIPNNGPVIVGITWWLTFFSGGFLSLRVYAKLSRRHRLWWDDYILITSWVLLLAEAAVTQKAQLLGCGKHAVDIPAQNLTTISLYISIGASISCFASALSKISFGVTLLRLTVGPLRWIVWFCIVTLFLFMIPSSFFSWIECHPREKAWNSAVEGTCWPSHVTTTYGIFNASWSVVADFTLALLPWKLIWRLQLGVREKLGVGVAMSLGMLTGLCAIVRGVYVIQLREQDFYYNGKDLIIWTGVETAAAIVGASIPVLRVLLKEAVSYHPNSRSRSSHSAKSLPLSRLKRSQPSSHTTTRDTGAMGKEVGWTTLEPTEDGSGDGASQKSILRDEEHGLGRDDTGAVVVEDGNILQATTITITVEENSTSPSRNDTWIGAAQ